MPIESTSKNNQPSKRALVSVGVLALVAGSLVVGLGAGWITSAPENLKAPRWVIISAGLTFIFAGVSMLGPRSADSLLAALIGALLVSFFAAVGCWVAFGSGPRHFGGAIGSGSTVIATQASEWSGRTLFGLGAVLLLAMSAWAWWRCLMLLRRRTQSTLP
jgi:hypothetical protein